MVLIWRFLIFKGNLPDPGKAQDFMKKFTQVLEDDEKIRNQLEMLVSPSCSCKQAEGCVVRIAFRTFDVLVTKLVINLFQIYIAARNYKEVGQSQTTYKPFPGND